MDRMGPGKAGDIEAMLYLVTQEPVYQNLLSMVWCYYVNTCSQGSSQEGKRAMKGYLYL